MQDDVAKILNGLHEASQHVELHRLPELFCGFHKRSDSSGPTLYPVACAPQAWAAGAPYLLLQASLGLTGQEMRVLERLAAGQSNKEIARTLGLSPNTVKTHLANLFAKLEVARRTQAVQRGKELGLLP